MTVLTAGVAGGTVIGLTTAASASPGLSGSKRSAVVVAASVNPYANAVDEAHERGLKVWLEVDMIKAWSKTDSRRDRTAFGVAIKKATELAQRPGVKGFKIADELGYRDYLNSIGRINRFLRDTATALRAGAPGKKIMVDLLVPQLGCVPTGASDTRDTSYCLTRAAQKYPQLTLENIDSYLSSGHINVVNLATHLRDDESYRKWRPVSFRGRPTPVTTNTAQEIAWFQATELRDWDRKVELRGRKALAFPLYGGTSVEPKSGSSGSTIQPRPRTRAAAEAALLTSVDIPYAHGAQAVDVWGWMRVFRGDPAHLRVSPGVPGHLWQALRARHDDGVRMSTHFSPFSVERGVEQDLDTIATVFTDVLVAAGTG